MALPENVAVRYTEDEAEYLSLRPVVRQTFRIDELVDMIVSVTGLDRERVAQILRLALSLSGATRGLVVLSDGTVLARRRSSVSPLTLRSVTSSKKSR